MNIGPVQAALRHVVRRMSRGKLAQRLEEESITSFILGGLACTAPLMIAQYGSGSESPRECSWGSYRKSPKGVGSEAESGADFALVIAMPNNKVRLALFQAKRACGKKRSDWHVNINYSPRSKLRANQLPTLLTGGLNILRALQSGLPPVAFDVTKGYPTFKTKFNLPLNSQPRFLQLHWIHYLAYTACLPVCISAAKLTDAEVAKEFGGKGTDNMVPLRRRAISLTSLLHRGMGDIQREGWLELDNSDLAKVVPELVALVTMMYVDDKGGGVAAVLANSDGTQEKSEARASSQNEIAALANQREPIAQEVSATTRQSPRR